MKQPLSRELIVSEALRQLAREGFEGMSLRKIALALDTGPASLYAYVDDLESLQALVVDRALASVDVSGGRRRGFRDRLKAVLESYVRVLIDTRGLARLAAGSIPVGPSALRVIEALLGLLDEGGVDQATAAWAVDLLVLYVTSIAAEQSQGHNPADPEGPIARAVLGASPEDFPRVRAAGRELLAGDGEQRFSWAIDVLLNGMLASPRPKTPKRAASRKPAPSSCT